MRGKQANVCYIKAVLSFKSVQMREGLLKFSTVLGGMNNSSIAFLACVWWLYWLDERLNARAT